MLRALLATTLLLSVLAALATLPRPAFACSAGLDFNPVRDSEVIVAGRLTGWTEVEQTPFLQGTPYAAVEVTMRVEHIIKGAVPAEIILFDPRSLIDERITGAGNPRAWAGSGGACGAFNADPTGRYAILGLEKLQDGSFGLQTVGVGRFIPHLPLVFYIGDAPSGERYEAALRRMAEYGPVALPSTGANAAGQADRDGVAAIGFLALFSIATVALGAAWYRRRTRHRPWSH